MMNQGSPHILVVDDHSEIRDLLRAQASSSTAVLDSSAETPSSSPKQKH